MPQLVRIHARLEDADVGQVAVFLRVVQPVADDEAVGDGEASILRLNDVVAMRLCALGRRGVTIPW